MLLWPAPPSPPGDPQTEKGVGGTLKTWSWTPPIIQPRPEAPACSLPSLWARLSDTSAHLPASVFPKKNLRGTQSPPVGQACLKEASPIKFQISAWIASAFWWLLQNRGAWQATASPRGHRVRHDLGTEQPEQTGRARLSQERRDQTVRPLGFRGFFREVNRMNYVPGRNTRSYQCFW